VAKIWWSQLSKSRWKMTTIETRGQRSLVFALT
jgi:hypothetical protein